MNKLSLKTLVIGCTPLAEHVVNLLQEMTDLRGVVNLDPLAGMEKSNYVSMHAFAKQHPDQMRYIQDINAPETIAWIKGRQPDIVVQCGWSQIFKPEVLNIPTKYCIGIHPSPLPIGRGAAVINWKLIEGGGSWGNSLFVMQPQTDTGAILDFEPFELEARDDARTGYCKVNRTAIIMLKRTLPKIADGTLEPLPQDQSQATRYYKRKPADGLLDLTRPAQQVHDMIRALTSPYPGAFIETPFGRLRVWTSELVAEQIAARPGVITKIEPGRGITLAVGNNEQILIKRVTPPDGLECWSDEWALSQNMQPGDSIEAPTG